MITPVVPIVNINGTSAESLVQQQRDIVHAAKALQRALAASSPHGRDYQYNREDLGPARDNLFHLMGMVNEVEEHAVSLGLAIMAQREKV